MVQREYISEPRRRGGFTLLELVATVVVLAILSGLAVVGFGEVRQQSRVRVTFLEATGIAREALGIAAYRNRVELVSTDFADTDFDRTEDGLQEASGVESVDDSDGTYWVYTSQHGLTARIYSNGTVSSMAAPVVTNQAGLQVVCVGAGITTCTNDASGRAMYLQWNGNEQGSYRISVTPSTTRGELFSSTSDSDRERYLGMGAYNQSYVITLTLYRNNSFTDVVSVQTITYTVPNAA